MSRLVSQIGMNSINHEFKYVLKTYHVLKHVLESEDRVVNQTAGSCLAELSISWERHVFITQSLTLICDK